MATHHEVTEHKYGEMDITEQQRTFAGFIKLMTWAIILACLTLIVVALLNA